MGLGHGAAGYTLGRTIPNIDKKIHYIIAAVIVASFIPAVYHAWKARQRDALRAASSAQPLNSANSEE